MTRIAGISPRAAPPMIRVAYFFTRRSLIRLTGRNPRSMLVPLELYAHLPGLLRAYGGLEQATAKLHRVSERLRNLAELKAATLVECEYCIDLGSQVARHSGLSDGPAPGPAVVPRERPLHRPGDARPRLRRGDEPDSGEGF